MGSKYSRFDLQSALTGQHHQVIEQTAALFRRGGGRKPGSEAFGRVRCQGKLWHQQQFTADLSDVEVHLVVIVGENPILSQTGQQSRCRGLIVGGFDAYEGEQAGTNSTDGLACHVHFGSGNTLK